MKRAVFTLYVCFALSCLSHVARANQQSPALQPPAWPIGSLNKEEKTARLQFFLSTQNYEFKRMLGNVSESDCKKVLEDINTPTKYEILSPYLIAKSRDDHEAGEMIRHCAAVPIDRVWFWDQKGPYQPGIDPKFDALKIEDRDAKADFIYKYDGEIEFYNLSPFFNGENIIGTFAERGVIVCNNPADDARFCKTMPGYRRYTGPVGTVFDRSSCNTFLSPRPKSSTTFTVDASLPYAYQERPSFSAFLHIGNTVYRLGLRSFYAWRDFSRLSSQTESTQLYIEPVSKNGLGTCEFFSKPKQ